MRQRPFGRGQSHPMVWMDYKVARGAAASIWHGPPPTRRTEFIPFASVGRPFNRPSSLMMDDLGRSSYGPLSRSDAHE